jgi:hypothetical protein
MTGRKLVVAAMPAGGGPAAARALVAAWGGVAEGLPPEGDLAAGLQDDPRPLLLLAEAPCTMLAHLLAEWPDADVGAALRQWLSAVTGWTRSLPARQAPWLAVDLDEARNAPQALMAAVRETLGQAELPAAAVPPGVGAPSLEFLLASGAVARDRRLRREAEALLSLCTPLASTTAAEVVDAGRALAAALPHLRTARAAAAKVGDLKQRLRAAGQDLAASQAALRSTRERLEAVEQENGLLVEQLLRAQDAWEQALAVGRRAEAALAEERAAAGACQAEQARQLGQLQQQAQLLQRAEAARQVAEQAAACARAAARVAQPRLLCRIRFDRLQVVAEDPTPTHRQLALQLQGLRVDDQACASQELRLVEHHGQAGLAWFAAADGSLPFARWQPQGEESGRAYMLLIPGDPRTWAPFEALGSTDWHAVLQVATGLADALADQDRATAWGTIAQAAAAAVLALPPALRFDHARWQGGAGGGELRLEAATFGPALWTELTLRWGGEGDVAPHVELHGSGGAAPPPALPAARADSVAQHFAAALAAALPRALNGHPQVDALLPRLRAGLVQPPHPAGGLMARLAHRLRRGADRYLR